MVRGIWKQKDEMFVLRYTLRSQEALNFISRRMQVTDLILYDISLADILNRPIRKSMR